jgi:ADP-ribose pyrophosphatase YjhB (NUDIX family)
VSKKPTRRTDYWDDPRAPAATSRKPSASVVLRNHRGELLLLRRVGSGLWTIPTGALKKKETATACAIRECREETGLAVELTGLVGVFSDPRHRIAYPDGEVRVPVNVCFYGQPVSGELATDSESDEAAWVAPEDLDDYDIHPAIRRRISHALHGTVPHVDLTAAGRKAVGWVECCGALVRRRGLVCCLLCRCLNLRAWCWAACYLGGRSELHGRFDGEPAGSSGVCRLAICRYSGGGVRRSPDRHVGAPDSSQFAVAADD